MLLASPLTYVLVVNPVFFNIFSASATVLFLTSGTTIKLSEEVEDVESSVEGIPKEGSLLPECIANQIVLL